MSSIENAEKRFAKKFYNYKEQLIENFIQDKGKVEGIDWNELCYVPIAATVAQLTQGAIFPRLTKEMTVNASLMASFAGWVANDKNILPINELLQERILKRSLADPTIDISAIFEKIGYGTYIDVRLKYEVLHIDAIGALVHIEHDLNGNRLELRVHLLDKNQKDFIPVVMHLIDGEKMSQCICKTLQFTEKQIDVVKSDQTIDIEFLQKSKIFNEHSIYAYYINDLIFSNILGFLLFNNF